MSHTLATESDAPIEKTANRALRERGSLIHCNLPRYPFTNQLSPAFFFFCVGFTGVRRHR
eukprot:6888464-Lingulodinium_polyedra.AAC.1